MYDGWYFGEYDDQIMKNDSEIASGNLHLDEEEITMESSNAHSENYVEKLKVARQKNEERNIHLNKNEATIKFGMFCVTCSSNSTRCSRLNKGFLLGLAATPTMTSGNRLLARAMRSV